MATILNELRASGGTDAIINSLELTAQSWLEPIWLCDGFVDTVLAGRLARATGMAISLPKKDATGAQQLRFALENVRGEVSSLVRKSIANQETVRLIYRPFVSSDLDNPADNPLHMIVKSVTIKGTTVDVTAGFFNLIDTQYPRRVYSSEFAPGLKYLD